MLKNLHDTGKSITFALAFKEQRAFSSAGLEHLPYKQRVGGSNPSTPTKRSTEKLDLFFYFQPPIHNPYEYIALAGDAL